MVNLEELIDIDRIPNLTSAQIRDFSMIKPYMESGNWVTSITLAKAMYQISDLSKKEISKCSAILSKLYHNTTLLERKQKRKIYFYHIHKKHTSMWAYRIDPQLIRDALKTKWGKEKEGSPFGLKNRQTGASGFVIDTILKSLQLSLFP